MSRYFFHLRTRDGYETDITGTELEDAEAAYLEAFHSAREICIAMLHQRRSAARYRFDVVDCEGHLVHQVSFSEAMCQPVANNSASVFATRISRGSALASDLAQEIVVARENMRACRELLTRAPTLEKLLHRTF